MKCPFCSSSTDYSNLGNHWRQSCGYPEPENIGVFDGLLMGDGCLKQSHKKDERAGNQSIEVVSINKKFVYYLYDSFSPFFIEPKVKISAEESAKQAHESDYISSSKGSTYREQYRIVTRALPFFNRYDKWKKSGKKRWPENIDFTPERLKYLYVADGGLSWNKSSKSARSQITSSNEPERLKEINYMLNKKGIDCSLYDDRVMTKPSSTDRFLDYLGEPVPGFEYKWENDDLSNYENLYQKVYYREGSTYTV